MLHSDATFVFDGLTGDGLPLVIVSLLCGIAVLVLLHRGARRGARAARGGRGRRCDLGLGRRPAPVPAAADLTIADAAAPSATLTSVLIVFGVAVVLVLPSIGLLFTLVQRNIVEETSQPPPGPTS